MPRAPINDIAKHSEAIMWINNLMIDLQLQAAGMEPSEPITAERLSEWDEHERELMECRKHFGLKY
jgi:hypothetical protein